MADSVPAVQNGGGLGSATVADAEENNSRAAMAVLWAGGSSKQTPPETNLARTPDSSIHVLDLPIKKRIPLVINQEAAEIQTETKRIQLMINQEATEIQTETRRIQLIDQETAETQTVCNICNRTFASSRSLAIHKGHHIRRGRARMQEQGAAGNPNHRMNTQRQSNGPGAVHECRRCGRSFVSGQALGAHKRHCTWPARPPIEQEIVNNFDLNEVPPPEEEDNLALPWHY